RRDRTDCCATSVSWRRWPAPLDAAGRRFCLTRCRRCQYRKKRRLAVPVPMSGGSVPRLIVIKGADEGKQFTLTGPAHSVGRAAGSPVRLTDPEVSRRHAEFRQADDGYRVVDVGSANGTFVNNRQVTDALLRSGDQVRIGQSVLVYSAGRGAARDG